MSTGTSCVWRSDRPACASICTACSIPMGSKPCWPAVARGLLEGQPVLQADRAGLRPGAADQRGRALAAAAPPRPAAVHPQAGRRVRGAHGRGGRRRRRGLGSRHAGRRSASTPTPRWSGLRYEWSGGRSSATTWPGPARCSTRPSRCSTGTRSVAQCRRWRRRRPGRPRTTAGPRAPGERSTRWSTS